MKTKTKSPKTKPTKKPTVDALQYEFDRAILDVLTAINNEVAQLAKRIDRMGNTPPQGERMITHYEKLVEVKRPTLKWVEQEPLKINWHISVDPATLILTPGTTLRFGMNSQITTYDGVTIGELDKGAHVWLLGCISSGAKLHVYLTSTRKLGIKLGRPE